MKIIKYLCVATALWLPLASYAGIVANVTSVTADGAPPKVVTTGADVSGHVLVVSGYVFDTLTGKAPAEPIQLQLTSSGQNFTAKPYATGFNEEAYLAMYDLLQKRPTAEMSDALKDAGWVFLLDTTTIPSGTYTMKAVVIGSASSSQVVNLNAPFTFTVQQGKNAPNAKLSAVAQDSNGNLQLTPVAATLVPARAGTNDFRFSGYSSQKDGVYRITYPAINPWGVHKEMHADFLYQRPTITAKISNPIADGFPGFLAQVPLVDVLSGQPINSDLGFSVDPLASGNGKVGDLAVGTEQASGVLKFDPVLGKHTVSATRTPMGDITLRFNSPDAPNLKLSVAQPWDPSTQVSLVPNSSTGKYAVDVAPFDAQIQLKTGSDCGNKVMLVSPEILGTGAGNIATGEVICGIKYAALPTGIKPIASSNPRLGGYLHDEGENEVAYDIGILYKNPKTGTVEFYASAHKTLQATGMPIDSAAPTVTFSGDPELVALGSTKESPLAFVGTDAFAARVKFDLPYNGFKVKMTDPSTTTQGQEVKISNNSYVAVMKTNAKEVWEEVTISYDISYALRPDKVWRYEFPITAVPRKPTIIVTPNKGTLVSTSTVAMEGKVGVQRGAAFSFDRNVQGDWRVKVVKKTTTGTATIDDPLSEDVAANDDGSFSINAGKLPPGGPAVAVTATLYRNGVSTGRMVRSADRVLSIKAGDSIESTLIVKGATSGRTAAQAPFKPVINVQIPFARQKDVGTIKWYQSIDGGGNWTEMSGVDGPGLRPSLTQAGTYKYRATVMNKHDQSKFDTNSVTVEAFVQPKVRISGPNAGFANSSIALTATSDTPDTNFAWTVRSASTNSVVATSTTDALTFTPTKADKYFVDLVAKHDVVWTIENAQREHKQTVTLTIVDQMILPPAITGTKIVETGKQYTYTVKQRSPFTSTQTTNATLVGKWILPDGTTVPGFAPLAYTPHASDKSLKFQSAVEGLESTTSQTTEFLLTPWTYKFPSMKVDVLVLDNRVPARIRYTVGLVTAKDLATAGNEKFTYEWSLPAGSTLVSNSGNVIVVDVANEGQYQLTMKAADTRGNSQEIIPAAVTILPAPELVAALKLTDPDPAHRAPNTLAARVTTSSLPKNDVVTKADFYLDGTFVTSLNKISGVAAIPVASAGNHTVSVRVTTRSGAVTEVTQDFSLVEASLPTCGITATGSVTTTLTLKAACTVDIGKIAGVKWYFDDKPTSVTSLQAMFTPTTLGNIQTVRVVAITDKGKEGSATWNR